MKRLLYVVAASLLVAVPVSAQDGSGATADNTPQVRGAAGGNSYYLDRKTAARMAIQQRAAYKAFQRQQRIESFKWYGYSPARPPASPVPQFGSALPWFGPVIYYQYPGSFFPRTAAR